MFGDNNPITNISCDANGNLVVDKVDSSSYSVCLNKEAVRNSIEDDLNNLKEEYENKLQREKVHIRRGDNLTGRRIHGRGRKIAISKGSFRNKKGIIGDAIGT